MFLFLILNHSAVLLVWAIPYSGDSLKSHPQIIQSRLLPGDGREVSITQALCLLVQPAPCRGQQGSGRGGACPGFPVLSLTFSILVSSSSYIRQLTLLLNELLFSILTTSGSRSTPKVWGDNDFSCCYNLRLPVSSLKSAIYLE